MELVKQQRIKLGISQTELSKRTGIASSLISDYERGARKPSVKAAKKLAPVLNIIWTDFFTEDDKDDETRTRNVTQTAA